MNNYSLINIKFVIRVLTNKKKNMNKENYPTWLVPIEIAKELKKIGFNEPCLYYNSEAISGMGYQCIEIEERIHNEDPNVIELRELLY